MLAKNDAWGDVGEAAGNTMPTLLNATIAYVTLRRNAGELNPRSAVTAKQALYRFARAVNPDLDVKNLRARHIEKWLATRTDVAPSTLRIELSNVKMFTRWAVRRGWLKTDPCEHIRGPKAPRSVPRHLPAGAISAVLLAADERGRLVILLMAQLGLRRLEVALLQHGDIDNGTLRISGKGGHVRILPLTEEVEEAIDAYLAKYPASNGPLIRSYTYPKRGLAAQYIGDLVVGFFRKAGIKKSARDGVSSHPIRHSCANDLLDKGVDIRLVQHTLGHAKLSTTAIYLQRRAALGALKDALEGRRYGD